MRNEEAYRKRLALLLALLALVGCGPQSEALIVEGEDTYDTSEAFDALVTTVSDDDLNGLWRGTVDGVELAEDAMVESWRSVGIRLTLQGTQVSLTRSADTLTGTGATLAVKANAGGALDDALEGTVNGKTVLLRRDWRSKKPITLQFPGDRPFRSYLTEVLMPAAQQDRESYTILHADPMGAWLRSCELYKHGSWLRKFMKGADFAEQSASFHNVIFAVDNVRTTPRRITKEFKFSNALKANLKDPSLVGLAMSTFGMYFSAAGGRSLRMPFTPDSMAYFITDRPVREEKIGVVAMDTPERGPLASTFGRQLLDMGDMPATDDAPYAKTLMELMAKSDVRSAVQLSSLGRSAITDWYAVMAIEDYRGVAFGFPNLGWGYNMTNVQFYGLVVRALARPGALDANGKPVIGQVVVGSQLRPGDPSYADVLNGGADMQEYSDMAKLKTLATQYLREKHPELISAVQAAFANVVPNAELDSRAKADIFHFICAQLYDDNGRIDTLRGAPADAAISSVTALFSTLRAESADFETWLLAHGLTKSSVPAPRSTGF